MHSGLTRLKVVRHAVRSTCVPAGTGGACNFVRTRFMEDTPDDFKPIDPGRINAMDPVELSYWCRQLGCSESALRAAVAAVGEHVAEVRERLATAP